MDSTGIALQVHQIHQLNEVIAVLARDASTSLRLPRIRLPPFGLGIRRRKEVCARQKCFHSRNKQYPANTLNTTRKSYL